jgi:hypothetical protein
MFRKLTQYFATRSHQNIRTIKITCSARTDMAWPGGEDHNVTTYDLEITMKDGSIKTECVVLNELLQYSKFISNPQDQNYSHNMEVLKFNRGNNNQLFAILENKNANQDQTQPVSSIKQNLETYIHRIEQYKTSSTSNEIDFSHGFRFFKQSRAINRKANYYLAKELLEQVNHPSETKQWSHEFSSENIKQRRLNIIKRDKLDESPNYKERGIHSTELNQIIKRAR